MNPNPYRNPDFCVKFLPADDVGAYERVRAAIARAAAYYDGAEPGAVVVFREGSTPTSPDEPCVWPDDTGEVPVRIELRWDR